MTDSKISLSSIISVLSYVLAAGCAVTAILPSDGGGISVISLVVGLAGAFSTWVIIAGFAKVVRAAEKTLGE